MNALDVVIVLMLVSSLLRGYEIGLVRQVFSTAGFLAGLFIGAELGHYTVHLAHTSLSRTLITILTTLGCAFVLLSAGELAGLKLKTRIQRTLHINRFDVWLGSLLGAGTLLLTVWLAAGVLVGLPISGVRGEIRRSAIISRLDRNLPPAPSVVASLGRLIDPNGFPQVFTGNEPSQPENTTVPGISPALQRAIDQDKQSAVKVEGLGCGGIVDGSGFVIGSDLVATNAHVVAGVHHPYVDDASGQHSATAVWFDPDLDFAVLRVPNLAGPPLLVSNATVKPNTLAAILGYPGGGPLTAGGASVLDEFTARGRDIYGQGITERDVYSLAAHVIPGNSGGPVIMADGTVVAIVFAESTTYNNVGYALSSPQLQSAISQAQAQDRPVSTGSCAE